jgi:hypothetical protein
LTVSQPAPYPIDIENEFHFQLEGGVFTDASGIHHYVARGR